MADYARVVLGSVNRRDVKTVERAERALAPIGDVRRLVNATRSGGPVAATSVVPAAPEVVVVAASPSSTPTPVNGASSPQPEVESSPT